MTKLVACMLVFSTLGSGPDPAHAEPADPAKIAAHVAAADQAFANKRYADAIRELTTAIALYPEPALLYALGQAQRSAGDCESAMLSYEAFLATGSTATSGGASLRDLAAGHLVECKRLRDRATEQALAITTVRPPAPAPKVVEPKVLEPTRVRVTDRWYHDRVGHVLTIAGVLAGGAGVGMWWIGRRGAIETNDAASHAEYLARSERDSERLQTIGVGTAIVGGVLVAGGILRYASAKRDVRIIARPGRDGMSVGVGGSW